MKKQISFLLFSIFILSCAENEIHIKNLKTLDIYNKKNTNPVEFAKTFTSVKKEGDTYYLGRIYDWDGDIKRVTEEFKDLRKYFEEYCKLNNGKVIYYDCIATKDSPVSTECNSLEYKSNPIVDRKRLKKDLKEYFEKIFSEKNIPEHYKKFINLEIDKYISNKLNNKISKILLNDYKYKTKILPPALRDHTESLNYYLICLDKKNSFLLQTNFIRYYGKGYMSHCPKGHCMNIYDFYLKPINDYQKWENKINTTYKYILNDAISKLEKSLNKLIDKDKNTLITKVSYPDQYKQIIKSININQEWNKLGISISFHNKTKKPFILNLNKIGPFISKDGTEYAVIYRVNDKNELIDIFSTGGIIKLKNNKILVNPNSKGYILIHISIPNTNNRFTYSTSISLKNLNKGILYIDGIPFSIKVISKYEMYKHK